MVTSPKSSPMNSLNTVDGSTHAGGASQTLMTPGTPVPAHQLMLGKGAEVKLTIDGQPVAVPAGTNLVEAAKTIGVEIPHYCYHQNLSVAGNCRMCQVEVTGARKLEIGCNTAVKEGMEVKTQKTSKQVHEAQSATLEFLLINHPLDCTVCDQAGHCKLQDYHYEYNAKDSRFLEQKEHKVKALPLGPTVVLDGERCILCTRCVRFCEEVTKTNELGVLNRGDRSVISVNQGRELTNALSGTVVDLCPVGALTHREWRFNTRIWFTKQTESICPGCSTGCNVKVAERDGQIVQVKARNNQFVNKEWLCDEGRYGFSRYLPKERVKAASVAGKQRSLDEAIAEAAKLKSAPTVVFISPRLLLEELSVLKGVLAKGLKGALVAMPYRERGLSEVEKILVSPDYAANFRGAQFTGLIGENPQLSYDEALAKFRSGGFEHVLFVGEGAVLPEDCNPQFLSALAGTKLSVAILCDAESTLAAGCTVVLPGRSILEKSGMLINRSNRLQFSDKIVEPCSGTELDWKLLNKLSEKMSGKVSNANTERELTLSLLASEPKFAGVKLTQVKGGGVALSQ